ncbi:MAG: PIN domain-containing protein [Actinobacteria bacterium]|nr:PIN domain-containing protein [Actinomycetota bacterium]
MIIVVDTGVFSAGLASKPRADLAPLAARMVGHQIVLAVQTVAELRYGALVVGWGPQRLKRLESSIAGVDVVPVDAGLVDRVARLRFACREVGHPLHDRSHANDLWIAATAVHLEVPLLSADGVFGGVPGLTLLGGDVAE